MGIKVCDVEDFLRDIPQDSADLVLADPPYGIDKDKSFGFNTTVDEWWEWCGVWISRSVKCLKLNGNMLIYASERNAWRLLSLASDMGLHQRRQIIWHYENAVGGHPNSLRREYETILWLSRAPKSFYKTIRVPYKSTERIKTPVYKNGRAWTPNPDGRLAGDVWNFPILAGKRFADERTEHPTQKPMSLTKRLVEHFSPPGGVVLIPFAGSGTECVAAEGLGRKWYASELRQDYVDIANRRLGGA